MELFDKLKLKVPVRKVGKVLQAHSNLFTLKGEARAIRKSSTGARRNIA